MERIKDFFLFPPFSKPDINTFPLTKILFITKPRLARRQQGLRLKVKEETKSLSEQ